MAPPIIPRPASQAVPNDKGNQVGGSTGRKLKYTLGIPKKRIEKAVLDDAQAENLHAMIETGKEYGRY